MFYKNRRSNKIGCDQFRRRLKVCRYQAKYSQCRKIQIGNKTLHVTLFLQNNPSTLLMLALCDTEITRGNYETLSLCL